MNDTRPIWLLDVDGVLNVVRMDLDGGYVRADTGYGPVNYHPAITARIAALHAGGQVDIRWLTTWMERTRYLAEAVGLPANLPIIGRHLFFKGDWWKAVAAREVADQHPDRLIIWTDDDLNHSYGAGELDWVINRRMLRISPDHGIGLTAEHMTMIEDAVNAHKTPAGQLPNVQ
jgi:hypothetical protein